MICSAPSSTSSSTRAASAASASSRAWPKDSSPSSARRTSAPLSPTPRMSNEPRAWRCPQPQSSDEMEDAFYASLARENSAGWLGERHYKAERIVAGLTAKQRDVFEDPWRYKAVVTPGQAGKTTLAGRLVLHCLMTRHQANVAYVSLTQKTAKRYLWEPLRQLNSEYDLRLLPHNTYGYFRAPDGGHCVFEIG